MATLDEKRAAWDELHDGLTHLNAARTVGLTSDLVKARLWLDMMAEPPACVVSTTLWEFMRTRCVETPVSPAVEEQLRARIPAWDARLVYVAASLLKKERAARGDTRQDPTLRVHYLSHTPDKPDCCPALVEDGVLGAFIAVLRPDSE